jgi:hypothetical protein
MKEHWLRLNDRVKENRYEDLTFCYACEFMVCSDNSNSLEPLTYEISEPESFGNDAMCFLVIKRKRARLIPCHGISKLHSLNLAINKIKEHLFENREEFSTIQQDGRETTVNKILSILFVDKRMAKDSEYPMHNLPPQ